LIRPECTAQSQRNFLKKRHLEKVNRMSLGKRFVVVVVTTAFVIAGWNGIAFGQAVATVQITGTVIDSSGAVVPDAKITVTQTQTGLQRSTTSGSEGTYTIPQLPVGPYTLNVEKSGFKKYVQTGISLQVGDQPRISIALQVGEVTEAVQVTADAEMVQPTQTAMATVIDQRRITDLPLNGRQATQLIILAGAASASGTEGLRAVRTTPVLFRWPLPEETSSTT
jgi:hypothetical protein